MTKNLGVFLGAVLVLGFLAFASSAYAAVPTFTLTMSGNLVSLTIPNDPSNANQPIYLIYPDANNNGSMVSVNLGNTTSNGGYTNTFGTLTYNGLPGGNTYVMVGPQTSAVQPWPGTVASANSTSTATTSTSTSGTILFNPSTLSLSVGAGGASIISGGSGYSIWSNSNSGVASVAISGSALLVNALANGTTNVKVCSANNGCGDLTITVGSGAVATTTPAVSTTTVTTPVVTSASSADVLSAIQAMQSQLAQLLTQIQAMSTALNQLAQKVSSSGQVLGASITVPSNSSGIFTQNLRVGSDGSQVLALQKYLEQKGFLTVAPNGHFGPSTQAALKEYQSSLGLEPVGYVGNATRAALNTGK